MGFWEHPGSKSKARQLRVLFVDPTLSSGSPLHHEVSALPRLKGTVPSKGRGSREYILFQAEPPLSKGTSTGNLSRSEPDPSFCRKAGVSTATDS